MSIFQDVMLQHKQGERELKRSEGDIIKKQQHLRRVMLDYENSKLYFLQVELYSCYNQIFNDNKIVYIFFRYL